jgi:hypothetical protein
MSYRQAEVHVSYEVLDSLWLIAKANPTVGVAAGDPDRKSTADAMADELLRKLIKEKFPQLSEHRKKVAADERELIKTLKMT